MTTRPSRWLTTGSAVLLLAAAVSLSGCRYAAVGQNIEGSRLMAQGNYAGALQRFQDAVTNDPASADAYYNMGRTFHEIGKQTANDEQLANAETLYNQCLDIDADHVDCHRALAVLLVDTQRPDRAFALLKNWATRNQSNADARIELARLYHEFGDSETARLHLDDAIAIDLTNPRAWTARGHLREEQGEIGQALANYQRSYQLNSLQPALAERIASIQRSNQSGLSLPTFNGTRMVNGGSTLRY
ncbi:MAG: tetratricopeptide repeat protein [Pirellulaceae bacterium]